MRNHTRATPTIALIATTVATAAFLTAGTAQADNRLGNHGHWNRTSVHAHVKMLDFTGDPWPVATVHLDWDQAISIDVDYVNGDPSSECGPDCVRVVTRAPDEDAAFGPNCTGAAGYWTNDPPGAGNHWTQPRAVRFNRSCNDVAAHSRRALTCQEMGHALGLDHTLSTDSCMHQNASVADVTPGQHDYGMLNNDIYDHEN